MTKNILQDIFLTQKEKCCDAIAYHQDLKDRLGDEEYRKHFSESSPYHFSLDGLIANDRLTILNILNTVKGTLEEYIELMNKLDAREMSVFLLGLGINWLPIRYWGVPALRTHLNHIDESNVYYTELCRKISDDAKDDLRKSGVFDIPFKEIIPDTVEPCELLEITRELNKAMYSAAIRLGFEAKG